LLEKINKQIYEPSSRCLQSSLFPSQPYLGTCVCLVCHNTSRLTGLKITMSEFDVTILIWSHEFNVSLSGILIWKFKFWCRWQVSSSSLASTYTTSSFRAVRCGDYLPSLFESQFFRLEILFWAIISCGC
jgi:hypothetical protein